MVQGSREHPPAAFVAQACRSGNRSVWSKATPRGLGLSYRYYRGVYYPLGTALEGVCDGSPGTGQEEASESAGSHPRSDRRNRACDP